MTRMSKKILIIEDDKILQETLKAALEAEGYEVVQSFDGEDGFNKIKKSSPNLILLDLIMPIRLGEWVLQQMNDAGIINKCPLIVLSAKSDEATISNCIGKYNIFHYIVKGQISLAELTKKIHSLTSI